MACQEIARKIRAHICRICQKDPISDEDIESSYREFKMPMCEACQEKAKKIRTKIHKKHPHVSNQQILIHMGLNHRGIDNELEYSDGHKQVDIAILDSKIYIEVNGKQHVNNAQQLISDMKRTYYSFEDGFLTLNVYNDAIEKGFNNIINAIREIIQTKKLNILVKILNSLRAWHAQKSTKNT
ncbi:MAG: DUF559 domain-containing protein [Prevotellaceae bacterium]|jgi:very-short-patch-repair endonuclease|nr:DUF559 domain-containing protein [Prevotellaceae bacterium]